MRSWVVGTVLIASATLGGCTADLNEERSAETTVQASPDRAAEASAHAEGMDRVWSCLREAGYRVTETGGEMEVHIPEGSDPAAGGDAAGAAIQRCQEASDLPQAAPLTDAELASVYVKTVEQGRCLEALGYDVSEAPSEDQFIEVYRQSLGGQSPEMPWYPLSDVPEQASTKALAACPEP